MKKILLNIMRFLEHRIHLIVRRNFRRILIDGGSFMHFDQFRLIAPALNSDPRLRVCITSSWGNDMSVDDLSSVAESFGFSKEQVVPFRRAKWMKWDLYLEACFDNPWLMWRCPRAEVFHGISEKYIAAEKRPYMIHPLAKTCDYLFCPNQRVVDGFLARPEFLKPGAKLCLTGMSRQDGVEESLKCEVSPAQSCAMGRVKSKKCEVRSVKCKTVLFAPTYGRGGLLHERGLELLRILVESQMFEVVVKLHPCSLMDGDNWNLGVDWLKVLDDEFGDADNFVHVVEDDISKLMCAADLIVGDFSSTTIDFAVTGKPTFFYKSDLQYEALCGQDFQWRLLETVAVSFDAESDLNEVVGGMKRASADVSDAVLEMREALHPFMGRATENVLREIYGIIGLNGGGEGIVTANLH